MDGKVREGKESEGKVITVALPTLASSHNLWVANEMCVLPLPTPLPLLPPPQRATKLCNNE
jgi:hypothetical protein